MAEYVTGLERTQEYIDRLQGVLQFFETLPQEKRNPVQEAVVGDRKSTRLNSSHT